MRTEVDQLAEIRARIAAHAGPGLRTAIDGLLVSRVQSAPPDFSMTEPPLVVMAQGGKRLMLGERTYEYRAGQCLVVTTDLPVTGHYIDISPQQPALAVAMTLKASEIAPLLLHASASRPRARDAAAQGPQVIATSDADIDLLDALARLLRLLDHPHDAPVLAPLAKQEILWRLLSGPHGAAIRQIGLPESGLTHVNRAIRWIRENYAEPLHVDHLARLAALSPSAFHRNFRTVTTLSPLQFQKRIRLQEARMLLVAHPGDVAGVGHLVGYDSASQFNREYRRLFGTPPGQDAARLRATDEPDSPETTPDGDTPGTARHLAA